VPVFNIFNVSILWALRFAGTRFHVEGMEKLPPSGQLILVGNHQSMYDIPFLNWTLRRYHLKYVTKVELGRWIPSISYSLRNMGSVLIERSNPRQAIPAIEAWTETLNANGWSAVIFPEGTRARNGVMKRFRPSGLVLLLEKMPNAVIVPVAIENSWKLLRHNLLPLPYGIHVRLTILDPVARCASPAEIVEECERRIRAVVEHGAPAAEPSAPPAP
jgi:1-acyl-sn-glycerol-3-phosphate acyltransferase